MAVHILFYNEEKPCEPALAYAGGAETVAHNDRGLKNVKHGRGASSDKDQVAGKSFAAPSALNTLGSTHYKCGTTVLAPRVKAAVSQP